MRSLKNVITKFLQDKHQEGEVIAPAYFWDLFDLPQPKDDTPFGKVREPQLKFMSHMEALKKKLLVEHQYDLQNVRGNGYRLVPFRERVECAVEDSNKVIRKALQAGTRRLVNIPHPEQLPLPQQKQREVTMIVNDSIRRMLSASRRYPDT